MKLEKLKISHGWLAQTVSQECSEAGLVSGAEEVEFSVGLTEVPAPVRGVEQGAPVDLLTGGYGQSKQESSSDGGGTGLKKGTGFYWECHFLP